MHLLNACELTAVMNGRPATEGRSLFKLLPQPLQELTAVWMGKRWYYRLDEEYFSFPHRSSPPTSAVLPSSGWKNVSELCRAAYLALKYLSAEDRGKMLVNLAIRGKHAEYLEEFVPLSRLQRQATVRYEAVGKCNKKADLLIECPGERPVLLEVKHRVKDKVNFFEQLQANGGDEDLTTPPDPTWLFRDVTEKLPEADFRDRAQGAWIPIGVSHEESALRACFDKLPSRHIHFAILSTSEDRAFVLGRTLEIEDFAKNFFRLTIDPHAVR